MLLRDAEPGLQTLLLRRAAGAGFVPDMYVFPGGRVDPADSDPWTLQLVDDLTPRAAEERLGLAKADPPAIAYYVAALREAFEEAGILVALLADGSPPPTAALDPEIDRLRNELMDDSIGFAEALARIGCRIDGGAVEYFAHWITPRRQRRRYDTRFFAARVEPGAVPIVDPREMTEARWVTPAEALDRHERGRLPMIRPTVRTLETLCDFARASEALAALAATRVETVLPDD